jgi:hypothetical protein
VTVFIVHNLAKEYTATYVFSNEKRKVNIELQGEIFSGRIGSYGSNIFLKKDGGVRFERDNYVILQNSAKNPYTALMAPAEETLHIILREHTERAIKSKTEENYLKNVIKIREIAKEWMAVEEAIVGACVRTLLPDILRNYINDLPESLIEKDLNAKVKIKKYRYLRKGIELVKHKGVLQTLHLYMNNPIEFKKLLTSLKGV